MLLNQTATLDQLDLALPVDFRIAERRAGPRGLALAAVATAALLAMTSIQSSRLALAAAGSPDRATGAPISAVEVAIDYE